MLTVSGVQQCCRAGVFPSQQSDPTRQRTQSSTHWKTHTDRKSQEIEISTGWYGVALFNNVLPQRVLTNGSPLNTAWLSSRRF